MEMFMNVIVIIVCVVLSIGVICGTILFISMMREQRIFDRDRKNRKP